MTFFTTARILVYEGVESLRASIALCTCHRWLAHALPGDIAAGGAVDSASCVAAARGAPLVRFGCQIVEKRLACVTFRPLNIGLAGARPGNTAIGGTLQAISAHAAVWVAVTWQAGCRMVDVTTCRAVKAWETLITMPASGVVQAVADTTAS